VYANPSPSESLAATKIATAWRRIRRRKIFMQGLVAIERWQQQQTAELCVPMQLWFNERWRLFALFAAPAPVTRASELSCCVMSCLSKCAWSQQVTPPTFPAKRHETKPLVLMSMFPDFKAAFMAWRAQSESTLPTRVNMRQRAYFMVPTPLSRHFLCPLIHIFQVLRVERSFLRGVMRFWEQITQEMQQGRNTASRWNCERDRLRDIIVQVQRAPARGTARMLCEATSRDIQEEAAAGNTNIDPHTLAKMLRVRE
jgi:hypothetical protein